MESEMQPIAKKRRRSKNCHLSSDRKRRSSSSRGSSVEVTTAKYSRPSVIATATPVPSSSQVAPSREEAAIAMATVLASELRPEHKLPTRDILVQPQPKFMELLQTVGAKGPVFTARQVLSYLIKYISSRQLYIQQDPKKVYCEKDPLGKVFGVPTFTIKDAKKLLFENMSVLREAPDIVSQHHEAFQQQQRTMYYTFHQAQQTTDVTRTISHPTRSATAPAMHPVPSTTLIQMDRTNKTATSAKGNIGCGKFSEPATTVATTVTQGQSVKLPPPSGRNRKRKQSRLTSDSSEDCTTHISSRRKDSVDSDKVTSRPWYCMLYHPSEELKSQGSEVLSIQDCETAIVADSSDDLWFVDEEEGTPVEYDVPSDSSDDYTINKGSSDDSSSGTEMVYDILLHREDSGDSHFADNSDEDTTDTEISDLDKWECTECSIRNLPFRRYCSRCWALRKGWLPDSQRMTLKERLQNTNRPLRRSFSAPAGDINPPSPSPWCQTNAPGHFASYDLPTEVKPTSIVVPESDLRDVPDGWTSNFGRDMPDGKIGEDKDEAGTGINNQKPTIKEQRGSSQDTIIFAHGSNRQTREPGPHTEAETSQNAHVSNQSREDSGIGLTQESTRMDISTMHANAESSNPTPVLTWTPSRTDSRTAQQSESLTATARVRSHPSQEGFLPRKRQRCASGSDLPTQSGLIQRELAAFKISDSSIHKMGMGVVPQSLQVGKSDPGAGPSSLQSSVVTKHYNDLCIICYSRPKTASIIHGRTGHQVCCYPCAKKLHHRGKPCPVCRRSIQAVIKNFLL